MIKPQLTGELTHRNVFTNILCLKHLRIKVQSGETNPSEMFLLWTFLPRRCALQILRVCLLNYSSKLTRNPIWQLLIFCCSDENVPTIDLLFSLQHVFHLGVNQKSKSHPDAPFRRSSDDEMEPTSAGEEALLAERSFTSPPTILPHNVMKRIRQTRARVLHKHRRNDPLCTQRHTPTL